MPITTTPSGGPQGEFSTYTPIYSTTLSGATASITFSNIPTTFTDLVLVSSSVAATGTTFPWMRFNGLSTNIYSDTQLAGNGTAAQSFRRTAQSRAYISENVQHSTTAGNTTTVVHIMNYSNTTTFKTYLVRNNNPESGTYVGTEAIVGLAQTTAPITSITIGCANSGTDFNLASGSTFTIYGIKAAATQFIPTKAAGGDVVVSDGTYAYHAFLSSGIFAPAQSLTCDYLVVAGGGAGGGQGGAGGGAGGFRTATGQSLSATSYSVIVGSGGAGVTGDRGTNGTDSVFNSMTSTGGGAAGGVFAATGLTGNNGGSGGGGNFNRAIGLGNTPSTSPSQGNNGGGSTSSNNLGTGGGGGAGAVGGTGTTTVCGAGGAGTNSYSTWASITNTGISGYYAGGGGGGGDFGATPGAGGAGGGGAGVSSGSGISGNRNTGGGGGGGAGVTKGGDGGSGIVIVRYAL